MFWRLAVLVEEPVVPMATVATGRHAYVYSDVIKVDQQIALNTATCLASFSTDSFKILPNFNSLADEACLNCLIQLSRNCKSIILSAGISVDCVLSLKPWLSFSSYIILVFRIQCVGLSMQNIGQNIINKKIPLCLFRF